MLRQPDASIGERMQTAAPRTQHIKQTGGFMKIAISAENGSLDSRVDPRFGRAAGFLIYDLDTDSNEYVSNTQNLTLAQGAGIQTAQNVAATGAQAVITGHVGPKAFAALNKGKVDICLGENMTVAESIQAFRDNRLTRADGATKPGHW